MYELGIIVCNDDLSALQDKLIDIVASTDMTFKHLGTKSTNNTCFYATNNPLDNDNLVKLVTMLSNTTFKSTIIITHI